MVETAILDFLVNELVLKALPILVLVVVLLEIIKEIGNKYIGTAKLKPFLPLISLILGASSMFCFTNIFADFDLSVRLIYGGIVGVLANGLYDQIKSLLKLKGYFKNGDDNGK